jgi:hypothetical protein
MRWRPTPVDQDGMATIWVLDDPRWRVDDSRPARSFTVCPQDGVTPDRLPVPPATDEAPTDVLTFGTLTAS